MQSLLTVQFVLAFVSMIVCVGLLLNAHHQQQRDWGYNQAHTLVIPVSDQEQYSVLRNEALQLPHVRSVGGAQFHVGKESVTWLNIAVEGESVRAIVFPVDPAYPESIGLRLKSGQFFEQGLLSEATEVIVINETFARSQGWDEPVGQAVRIDSTTYTVIGVTEDFHYDAFYNPIEPVIFRLADESTFRYLTVRIAPGGGVQTAEALESVWSRLEPEVPTEFFFQDSVFDEDFQEFRAVMRVFLFVGILALLISCMGLFGLSAQNTARRMKEIGVRKVLGASLAHLTRIVNFRFAMLLVLAALVATPIGYFLLNTLLDLADAYRMEIGPLAFLIAYGVVFVTGLLTLSSQVYRLAAANPVDLLRDE